jgi:2-polyprenyl-6-methoxyphenol hydroxylase-like FAD-dependent oxidoreductase
VFACQVLHGVLLSYKDGPFPHLSNLLLCPRYEEGPAGGPLTVHFSQRCGVAPITAFLLVAADGYFSRVRQQVTGDGPPDYCHTLCWRARLPATPEMCSIGMSETGDATTMVMDAGRLWLSYPIRAGSEGGTGEVVWTVSAQGEGWGLPAVVGSRLSRTCGCIQGSGLAV